MQERRNQQRILAFCQVLDLERNFIGVSFDLTPSGICLSLPKAFPKNQSFLAILKRGDAAAAYVPEVLVTIQPVWRRSLNQYYDELGGKIIQVKPEKAFLEFYRYCQQARANGLFAYN